MKSSAPSRNSARVTPAMMRGAVYLTLLLEADDGPIESVAPRVMVNTLASHGALPGSFSVNSQCRPRYGKPPRRAAAPYPQAQ